MNLKSLKNLAAAVLATSFIAVGPSFAQTPGTVVDIAVGSPDHTTLVAAVTAAGLVETLSGDGKFTVFAPTNDAFAKLPEGTVDTLLLPESKATLTKVLTAHVVAGEIRSADLVEKIKAHHGRFNFQTVSGDALTAMLKGAHVYIFDESGGAALVTAADLESGNGVVHVVNDVLLPK